MKTILDIMDNTSEILTQFNDFDYPTAMALIAMCVEEYCLAHNLDATEVFEELLITNREITSQIGKYNQEVM